MNCQATIKVREVSGVKRGRGYRIESCSNYFSGHVGKLISLQELLRLQLEGVRISGMA